MVKSHELPSPAALAALPDDTLIEAVQRRTFRFFWDGAHKVSGLALDRLRSSGPDEAEDDVVAIGGSGFGIMALIVAVERGWVTRDAGVVRCQAGLQQEVDRRLPGPLQAVHPAVDDRAGPPPCLAGEHPEPLGVVPE